LILRRPTMGTATALEMAFTIAVARAKIQDAEAALRGLEEGLDAAERHQRLPGGAERDGWLLDLEEATRQLRALLAP
jgi:hypothetical protein